MRKAIGLGIKTAWTQEELDRASAFANRPVAWFDSRDEAATRYLRVSGLTGLLPADDPAVDAGLRQQNGQWRLELGVQAVTLPGLHHNAHVEDPELCAVILESP